MKVVPVLLFSIFLIASAFAQNVPQSVRICALRVEFQPDQNDLTSGNGLFMVDSVTTDPYAIDPAPHNRLYFQDQIRAAANYYAQVSQGKLSITGDVFPSADKGAYRLPKEMGAYNPNTTNDQINEGLANLFKDAIEAAKAGADSIDFGQYELVVVFHAGVGKDIDVGYDPTPQDISSLYVTPKFLQSIFGTAFPGVDTGNGHYVDHGIILPETLNQEGYALALTGMFVSNIGSYLGLYDLFSPSKQRTGVGRFGLMDVGLMNMNGLIPSPPGAFSRYKLGWDQPLVLTQPQNGVALKRLGSGEALPYPTLVKVPINEDEYYLLEYRGDASVSLDSLYDVLLEDRTDLPTYLELLETHFHDQIVRGESGVLISVPDYDWGLPGAGILIWHVDERLIRERGATGSINDDPELRAVDIEEADGSEDIGQSYTLLDAGFQKELGWFADFWFSNRPQGLDGYELYKNEFSSSSVPATRSNRDQAFSHIKLSGFTSNQSAVMYFNFTREWLQPGFPLSLFTDSTMQETIATVSGMPEGGSASFIFALNTRGELYALDGAGKGFSGGTERLSARLNASAAPQLALGDVNANGQADLLFAAAGDTLYYFNLDASGLKQIHTSALPAKITAGPVFAQGSVAVTCANDTTYLFDVSGLPRLRWGIVPGSSALVLDASGVPVELPQKAAFAAVAPFADQKPTLVLYEAATQTISLYSYPEYTLIRQWSAPVQPVGPFAFADVNGNGLYDLLFAQADGIYAFNRTGVPLLGFPLRPGHLSVNESLVGSPLILDVDGDGSLDFLIASNQGNIFGFSRNGKALPGFPLSTGGTLSGSPAVLQMDADSGMELTAVTTSGTVYAWQLDTPQGDPSLIWLQEDNNAARNLFFTKPLIYKALSGSLMPAKRVFNYPNPNTGTVTKIHYYLNETATVTIRIFDVSGMPVATFSGPGMGGADNEIGWDISDVASGIYLCRVEARSAKRSANEIIKIMVVH